MENKAGSCQVKYFANNSKNGTCELMTKVYRCISGRPYRTRNGEWNKDSTAISREKSVPLRRDCTSWPHYSSQRFPGLPPGPTPCLRAQQRVTSEEAADADWLNDAARSSPVRGKKFVSMWKPCVSSGEGEEEAEKLRSSDYRGTG